MEALKTFGVEMVEKNKTEDDKEGCSSETSCRGVMVKIRVLRMVIKWLIFTFG